MKHAILILAHKNVDNLCRLINCFPKDCYVFVHFDKKTKLTPEEEARICLYAQVKRLLRQYEVNWGGTSILYAEILLLRTALQESDARYFHLISGQDYPLCSFATFDEFFTRNEGKEFVKYVHLPNPRWEKNTYRRFQYYFPFDDASDKENPRGWVRDKVREQARLGVKREIPDMFDYLYGSSQWFSISRMAVETLLDYTDTTPNLYRRMWMTFAPEESYVATVLVNLLGTERVVSDNRRFIWWRNENGNCPANLDQSHFRHLVHSGCFFARKMEPSCSEGLLDMIDKYMLSDSSLRQADNGGWLYNGYRRYDFEQSFCDFVQRLCQDASVRSALDIGCGDGQYVAQWRRANLPFAGYDANPFTPSLSRLLLDADDEVCGVADLTEELSIDNAFDLVVCKDVLQFIHEEMQELAIHNLSKLSSHYIVLSWHVGEEDEQYVMNTVKEDELLAAFMQKGFKKELLLTIHLRLTVGREDCCILAR